MVGRGALTAAAGAQRAPARPSRRRRGRPWRDHRRVINGILWKRRPGAPWRDLPTRYGPWQSCYDRCLRWRRDGTCDHLLTQAQPRSDAVGEGVWAVRIDSTTRRAHQHAAGARQTPARAATKGRRRYQQRVLGAAVGADAQAASRLRRQGAAAFGGADAGAMGRHPATARRAGRHPRAAARRHGPAPQATRAPAGRHGLQPSLHPTAPAAPRPPAHHPRTRGASRVPRPAPGRKPSFASAPVAATWSSAGCIACSSSVAWPPAMTSGPPTAVPSSSLLHCCSGSPHDLPDTP